MPSGFRPTTLSDPARLAAIARTGLVGDAAPSPALDRLTRSACRLLHAPSSLVSLLLPDRQVVASCIGLPDPYAADRTLPLSHSFCHHVVTAGSPLIVGDARDHPELRDNPAITDLKAIAYAGFPLATSEGHVLGTLCAIDSRPRTWSDADVSLLADLAAAAMTELELRLALADADEQRAFARELLAGSPDAFLALDDAARVTFASDAAERLLDRPRGTLVGRVLWEEFPEAAAGRLGEGYRRVVEERTARGTEEYFPSVGRWMEVHAAPSRHGVSVYFRDISERRAAEHAVREREARLRLVLSQLPALLWTTDFDLRFTSCSGAGHAALGIDPSELVGTTLLDRLGEWPQAEAARDAQARALAGESVTFEFRARDRVFDAHVEPLRGASGRVIGVLGLALDVTDRRRLEEDLVRAAFHDGLTGLSNRRHFRERVENALARAGRGSPATVLFLDLDDFKAVNDRLGHAFGDRLLQAVAERMLGATRTGDSVARLGGDEFAVLLEGASSEEAIAAAERIAAALASPITIDGSILHLTASVGAATGQPGDGADDLLRNADVAMYRAKESGKRRVEVFEPHMHATLLDRLELAADLRGATERDELRVLYQPVVDLATGRLRGAEALARWHHPRRGTVHPGEFIPLAEENGTIMALGPWVLARALRDLRRWHEAGATDLVMSVNVSGRQLHDPDFALHVARALAESAVDPSRVVLEITESVLMRRADETLDTLHALSALGVQLAIDDFGTGYSSLSYLQQFPVDVLKIDKTFVDNVARGAAGAAFVRTIVALGDALSLRLVAEGVERSEQRERLQAFGCPLGQGFLFDRPLSAEEFGERVTAHLAAVAA